MSLTEPADSDLIIRGTHEPSAGDAAPFAATPADVPASLLLLFATGAGLAAASLYYAQPLLGVLGADLRVGDREVGLVPVLTQVGYAAGIFFLAPLGDRFDRRKLILGKATVLASALLLAGLSRSLPVLLAASLLIGLSATMAQDIVPAAASLAPAARRGKVVGSVMTGLLLGILLSRTVGGVIANRFGWRATFLVAAASIVVLGLALWRGLPTFVPRTELSYRALLGSIAGLVRVHAPLRRAALAQGLLSVGFGAFWSTLAVMLHRPPFSMGAMAAGAFGLAGAAGALAAPLAGRVADRRGPELVTRIGAALAAVSFASMAVGPAWGASPALQIVLLVLAAIGFDFGVQASLVSHQTIVYGIDPLAQSRLNAVLMTGMFIGMATGAGAGSVAFGAAGWNGVTAVAAGSALLALVVRVWPR